MSHKDRIAQYISINPQGVNDTEISIALGITNHATTNQVSRQLVQEGFVERKQKNGILHNYWKGIPYEPQRRVVDVVEEMSVEEYHKKWYWEGNVQSTLVRYLRSTGFQITQDVDTSTHQRGVDIIAHKEGKELWVTVKGYPRPKATTNPRLQCVHWFSSALYDIIKYREKDQALILAIALPDFERYRNICREISWFKQASRLSFYWIKVNGEVEIG